MEFAVPGAWALQRGQWLVDENVAYVSDEEGMLEQGLLASLQVPESQLCDLRPTTFLWISVSSSIKWVYS